MKQFSSEMMTSRAPSTGRLRVKKYKHKMLTGLCDPGYNSILLYLYELKKKKNQAHKIYKQSMEYSDYMTFSILRKKKDKCLLQRDRNNYIGRCENDLINKPLHFWKYAQNTTKNSVNTKEFMLKTK